jgi:hypothetical protein
MPATSILENMQARPVLSSVLVIDAAKECKKIPGVVGPCSYGIGRCRHRNKMDLMGYKKVYDELSKYHNF